MQFEFKGFRKKYEDLKFKQDFKSGFKSSVEQFQVCIKTRIRFK
jgi:hypothetical protein